MNRGDVVLLVLWCLMVIASGYFWELSQGTVITLLLVGGTIFGVRLWLARRTFR